MFRIIKNIDSIRKSRKPDSFFFILKDIVYGIPIYIVSLFPVLIVYFFYLQSFCIKQACIQAFCPYDQMIFIKQVKR